MQEGAASREAAREASRPRPAATVILLRPSGGGLEVLLLRRHRRSSFAADAWVFPGGVVDAADATLPAANWRGIDPEALAARFRADAELVLGLHVAAVRETFEEAGVLLAHDADGRLADPTTAAARGMREVLADRGDPAGGDEFRDWVSARELVLDLGALTYWSHWITPEIESKRFDTRFFVAAVPAAQQAAHDTVEVTDHRWLAPEEGVAGAERGELLMLLPTVHSLAELAEITPATPEAVVGYGAARLHVPTVLPHVERGDDGSLHLLHPGDPGYPYERYAEYLQ